jgi:hypothetical protein
VTAVRAVEPVATAPAHEVMLVEMPDVAVPSTRVIMPMLVRCAWLYREGHERESGEYGPRQFAHACTSFPNFGTMHRGIIGDVVLRARYDSRSREKFRREIPHPCQLHVSGRKSSGAEIFRYKISDSATVRHSRMSTAHADAARFGSELSHAS